MSRTPSLAIVERLGALGGTWFFPSPSAHREAARLLAGDYCRNCDGAGGFDSDLVHPSGGMRHYVCPVCNGSGVPRSATRGTAGDENG